MKKRTRRQVETAKGRAERFLRDVLDDDDRADEVADESVEDYAERKHIEITNPSRRGVMATKQELADENDELRAENEQLQARLDRVMDIVAPDGDEDDDDQDDDQDDEEDDDQEDDEDGDEEDDEEEDGEALAAGSVPARENGAMSRFVSRRVAERRYERAVARKAIADVRAERARGRLGK